MGFNIDSELNDAINLLTGGTGVLPPSPPVGEVDLRRTALAGIQTLTQSFVPEVENVVVKDYSKPLADGHNLLLRWYTKADAPLKDSPAVLYIHGGGLIASCIDLYHKTIALYVSKTGVPFVAVEYRLAPEHPYPTPVEDCYAALEWLHENAAEFGVDTKRIAVMGDSAGGGLAACLTHLIREKNGPALAKQILIYPMLDDRNTVEDPTLSPFAVWSYADNITGWQGLLGEKCGKDGVPATAAAARMSDPKGLPELYLDVGELDIFRDEDITYAMKHMNAGISTELRVHPGVPHAWETFAPEAAVSKRAMEDRMRAVMTIKTA